MGLRSMLYIKDHIIKKQKQKIMEKCGLSCVNRTITSHKMLPPASTIKQYVDEFFNMDQSKLVIDENAYYTGTPKDGLYGIYEQIYDRFQIIRLQKAIYVARDMQRVSLNKSDHLFNFSSTDCSIIAGCIQLWNNQCILNPVIIGDFSRLCAGVDFSFKSIIAVVIIFW